MNDPANPYPFRKILIFLGILISVCFSLPSDSLAAANRILNIRHWVAPDHTRIVIDTRDAAKYRVFKEGQVLSLYFRNCDAQSSLPNLILLKKRGIEKINHEAIENSQYKIDLFLDEKVETKIFNIKRVEEKPYRIVIDIIFPDVEKSAIAERTRTRQLQRDRIIIIDPGHGGDDPGAVGQGGTYEKDVVLDIGRKLKNYMNQQAGYRSFLTRDGDYYVPFKKRMQIAREYGAAMFISIHADAASNREARGSSIYCLSASGASSAAARILANKENLADMVGGSPNGDSSEASDPIILNMCQTNTLNVSKNFGIMLLNRLGSVGNIKFRTVQEAQLRVLKLPEIPSVLIETAYISNPEEEEWLKDPDFQSRLAETIGKTIYDFEPSAPVVPSVSPAVLVYNEQDNQKERKTRSRAPLPLKKVSMNKAKETNSQPILIHKVKRGESLEKIAARYSMTSFELAGLNDLSIKAPLLAGKKLKVLKRSEPGSSGSEASTEETETGALKASEMKKTQPVIHKVQRGETLDTIARHYHTSVAALLKANGINRTDRLYAGTTIRLLTDGSNEGGKAGSENIAKKTARSSRNSRKPSAPEYYEVQKGDSLDSISREHHTTVADLMKFNSLKKNDTLFAGKKIRIAAEGIENDSKKERKLFSEGSDDSRQKKAEVITYKVKRGDTLDTIARRYKTRIGVLLSLNKLKLTDPLYANQSIKLPRDSSVF